MSNKSISVQEFRQNPRAAEDASRLEPVFLTEEERPLHVLVDIEEYRHLIQGATGLGARPSEGHAGANILEMLRMPEVESLEFEPPRLDGTYFRPAAFE